MIDLQILDDFALTYNHAKPLPGRISLSSTLAIPTTDLTSQSTLYWQIVPGQGVVHTLFDGNRYRPVVFNNNYPISLPLANIVSGLNYDVFLVYLGGSVGLVLGPAWTSDTVRSVAITQDSDGMYYLNGNRQYNYVGTIRASSDGVCEDSFGGAHQTGGKRFVWNMFNRRLRRLGVIDTTDTWTYTTATWRQSNGAAGNKVEFVLGIDEDIVSAEAYSIVAPNNAGAVSFATGIGLDSTNTNSCLIFGSVENTLGAISEQVSAIYRGNTGIGYHSLNWLEISSAAGTTTWIGDNGDSIAQSGLQAILMA